MIEKIVLDTIKEHDLISPGDKVLVAFSGGPDSVTMLYILNKYKEQLGITLYAAHLNHMIRGIDAYKDAMFCSQFCQNIGIHCIVKTENIPLLSKEEKTSEEETARKYRYKMLDEVSKILKTNKIALAHNLDDQVETILMRLIRGTGPKGLLGMDYKRDNKFIRPIMDVEKKDITNYCKENKIKYQIDYTNSDPNYHRNNIRLKLIPYLIKEYNPNIKNALIRTSKILREDYEYITIAAKDLYEKSLVDKEEGYISVGIDNIKNLHKSMLSNLIRTAITELIGFANNIEQIHINQIISLIESANDKYITLPNDIIVTRKAKTLDFSIGKVVNEIPQYCCDVNINGYTKIDSLGYTIITKVMPKEKSLLLPTGKDAKVFDYDKLKGTLKVRSRKTGDKMKPLGLNGTKKIKDILIELKVANEDKHKYPVFEDDKEILWIKGYRISENYKVDENTKQVIRIQIKEQ